MKFDDLERIASERPVSVAEAKEACEASARSLADVIEVLSLNLARRYMNHEASFSYCDTVMNNLSPVILLGSERGMLSNVAWSVYLAFDEGEYHHQKSIAATNSEDRFTRPMIAEILKDAGETRKA